MVTFDRLPRADPGAGDGGWAWASGALDDLAASPDWNGFAEDAVRPEIVAACRRLLGVLRRAGVAPPAVVYPMPHGTIIFDWWNHSDEFEGAKSNLEVEGEGRGELMFFYGDSRASEFFAITWDDADE